MYWLDRSIQNQWRHHGKLQRQERKWQKRVLKEAPNRHCLTMINPATCWFKIAQVDDKLSAEITIKLEITWLTHYPIPQEVIADCSTKFLGKCLRMLEKGYNMKCKSIMTRNPQANSIVECIHQTIGDMIHTKQLHEKKSFEALRNWVHWRQ